MGSPVELRRVRRPRSMRAGLYAFGISLIEVSVFLPTPDVTVPWRVVHFSLRRAAEPISPRRFECDLRWLQLAFVVDKNRSRRSPALNRSVGGGG